MALGRGAKFCAERDVATADLGVLCAKDGRYRPARFWGGALRQHQNCPTRRSGASCSSRGRRLRLWAAAPAVLAVLQTARPVVVRECGSSGDAVAPSLIVLDS